MKTNFNFRLIALALVATSFISLQAATNYILNPGFELDGAATANPVSWTKWSGNNTGASAAAVAGDAHSGSYYGKMASTAAYSVFHMQTITGLPSGIYSLKGWFRSSGGQGWGNFSIKNYGGAEIYRSLITPMSTWTQLTIDNLVISTGTCEIDIYNPGSATQWTDYDDLELTMTSSSVVAVTGVSLNASTLSLAKGESSKLTETVLPVDATTKSVNWTTSNSAVATVTSTGIVKGLTAGTATITATSQVGGVVANCAVTVSNTTYNNLVLNPGFEFDGAAVSGSNPLNWNRWSPNATTASASVVSGDAHTGSFYGKLSGAAAYNVMMMQTISGIPAGTYNLKGWFRSSGGQGWGNMSIKNHGSAEQYAAISTPISVWTEKSIMNVTISTGTCEIDLYNPGSATQWTDFDDIELSLVSLTTDNADVLKNKISVYPNVIKNNVLSVLNSGNETCSVSILNLNGQALYTGAEVAGNTSINTSFLAKGMYIVKVSTVSGSVVQKIIIQ